MSIEVKANAVAKLYEDLEKAKEHVKWLLENPEGSVDFHDIVYWSGRIVDLRKQIKEML